FDDVEGANRRDTDYATGRIGTIDNARVRWKRRTVEDRGIACAQSIGETALEEVTPAAANIGNCADDMVGKLLLRGNGKAVDLLRDSVFRRIGSRLKSPVVRIANKALTYA